MIFDIVGVTILAFCLLWMLASAYLVLRPETRIAGIILLLVSILSAGAFLFMTRSTPARRAYINLEMRALVADFVVFAVAFVLACIMVYVLFRLAWWLARGRSSLFGAYAAAGILITSALMIMWLYQTTFEPDLDKIVVDRAQLLDVKASALGEIIPIQIFEDSVVELPTALALGPDNELYVASNDGSIWVMFDNDQDGRADEVITFIDGLDKPQGLAWSEDGIYVNVDGQLLLITDTDGDWQVDESQVIVDGLPGETYAFHRNHGITFGADGRIYIGVGATSDSSEEQNPLAARILSVMPDGSDLQVYATGVRNPYGIIPAPDGEGFFAVDNGASGCRDEDCAIVTDVPEEVNYIREGNDYGFPNHFGVPAQSSDSIPPVISLPEHTAPTGIVLYEGAAFPEALSGQLFVSLWATGEIYRIRLFRIDEDHYTGSATLFATGIPGPSAMVNSPYGGIFVASFNGNAIYHIGAIPEN